jgi:hypothetical protein
MVRKVLEIPSPYYVKRGFSPAILDAFDVGHSRRLKCSIIPLYDDSGQICTGHFKRSEKPLCDHCQKCHFPTERCHVGQSKWRISAGFPQTKYLYNYAAALSSNEPFVLVVEGPGDVFRLAEAGLPAVAIMGRFLQPMQAATLAYLAKKVIISFDNDSLDTGAAIDACSCLEALGVSVGQWSPPEQYNDWGEMPTDEVIDCWKNWQESKDQLDPAMSN